MTTVSIFFIAAAVLYDSPPWLPNCLKPAVSAVQNGVRAIKAWISPAPAVPTKEYEVMQVIDGDTLLVKIEGEAISVRLIGVDAPESVHRDESRNTPEGVVASDWMKQFVTGKKVSLEYDQELYDRYGRTLAYVYVDGVLLEDELLRAGMAITLFMEPNNRYEKHFADIEREARRQNAGFWGTGFFQKMIASDA